MRHGFRFLAGALAGACLLGSAATAQVQFRWTLGFAQGTSEAIIRNARGSSLNIYCPSGQTDTTPGIFLEVRGVPFRSKVAVPAQVVVGGGSFPFTFEGGHVRVATRIGRQTLQSLVDALATARDDTFVVELPSLNKAERFSMKDAYRVLGGTGSSAFLNGCAD